MADPEAQRSKKVPQSALDEIKKIGMSAALKKYTAGEGGPEFKTAMERYYSPQRLKGSSQAAIASQGKSGGTASENKTPNPVPMPASAPAAAARRSKPKGMAQNLGAPTPTIKPKSPKKSTAFEAAAKAGNKGGIDLSPIKKKKGNSRIKEQYAKQKEGSKFKGAFSGLGG